MPSADPQLERQPVWDPCIRIWHWALACSVTAGWLIGEYREFDTIRWHFYAGYTTLGLLAFRLLWGFVGPAPVRFSGLLRSLRDIPAYLGHAFDRKPGGSPGHNPLGALSVIAMLMVLTLQATTGLFAEDDGLFSQGPFSHLLDSSQVVTVTAWHHYGATAILVLVALHLAAVAFYRIWKREDLVMPMITGKKWVRKTSGQPSDS